MSSLRVELFDGLRILYGEQQIQRFRTQKAGSLLAFLAYFPDRVHSREELLERFWPDCDPNTARGRLSASLSQVRRHLADLGAEEEALLRVDRETIFLNSAAITTDVGEFERALGTARGAADPAERRRALGVAVNLYRGELLRGYYDSWIFPEQARLALLYQHTLTESIQEFQRCGELHSAIDYATRAVRQDPLSEDARLRLIRLFAAAGQPALALAHYRDLERLLRTELDVEPSQELRSAALALGNARSPEHRPHSGAENVLRTNPAAASESGPEPVGGAMAPTSRFYVERAADAEFAAALRRRPGILRLKGSRQTGKSSLLARAALLARESGCRVALTDLQTLTREQTSSRGACLRAFAESLSDQLELPGGSTQWNAEDPAAAGPGFRRFLREHVLSSAAPPLLWMLDDVDRLFEVDFREELFALFRSWYNERAFDPSGPFPRLTLLLAYATEAYLFIRDLNQSPFNVGVGIALDDFNTAEVTALNERLGCPLSGAAEIGRFVRLVGGHPFLVQVGLQELATRGLTLPRLEELSASETGPFGEHLRRLGAAVDREPDLRAPLRDILHGKPPAARSSFHRLRSLGVVAGASEREARLRCELYVRYLQDRLEGEP